MREVLEIDKERYFFYWAVAIKREIGNILMTFKLLDDNEPIPTG